jgi:hypothetical protein
MQVKALLIAMAVAMPSVCAKAWCQEGPSLDVTVQWLRAKLVSDAVVSICMNGLLRVTQEPTERTCTRFWLTRIDNIGFDKCVFSWTAVSQEYAVVDATKDLISNNHSERTFIVPLYEIYSTQVVNHSDESEVALLTGGRKTFQERSHSHMLLTRGGATVNESDSPSETVTDSAYLAISTTDRDDKDNADRIVKAFTHARDLCKSQRPQNTEPF